MAYSCRNKGIVRAAAQNVSCSTLDLGAIRFQDVERETKEVCIVQSLAIGGKKVERINKTSERKKKRIGFLSRKQ